ncbi:fused DSP-PTPase phosphatase/NAD kinase-like protein [Pelagovum pacificum]|uniref:fused DSP-PTPase phosphatase/NAD kinase-like protein n=1 Tax=Pelagovum pacificum TaxID=2588711 RepID=UPI0018CD1B16|nr:tyrosine-protein phosphatase [Pelagovum pacificum]QQA44387.1 tyrosine-protein phosphatase [Pelagovum pacificum]
MRKYLEKAERDWRRGFGQDITGDLERRQSFWHYNWLDHAHWRRFLHNQAEIAPGIFRSNQPTLRRLRNLQRRHGLKTVVNLRGKDVFAHYLFLKENCERLGLDLIDVKMRATRAPLVSQIEELIAALEVAERPLLLHCKSGADRTGMASVIYMHLHEGVPISEAKRHLSFRHLHIRRSSAGILDYFLDLYEYHHLQTGIGLLEWVRTGYDPEALTAGFRNGCPIPCPPVPKG